MRRGTVLTLGTIVALAIVAVGVWNRDAGRAEEPQPHPDFAIGLDLDGDGTNDCGTGVPGAVGDGAPDPVAVEVTNTQCVAQPDASMTAYVYVIDNAGVAYIGSRSVIRYDGVVAAGPATGLGDACPFQYYLSYKLGLDTLSCGTNQQYPPVTSLGLIARFPLVCTYSGSLSLVHGDSWTYLSDMNPAHYEERYYDVGPDQLTIHCGDRATVTPTPTLTPTPTPTPCPACRAIGIDVGGDGTNDCGSGVPGKTNRVDSSVVTNTTCDAVQGAALVARVYLTKLLGAYSYDRERVVFTGIESKGRGKVTWGDCIFFPSSRGGPGYEETSCQTTFKLDDPRTSRYTGPMARFTFTCTSDGPLALDPASYAGQAVSDDVLTITCLTPTTTPSPTPVSPTGDANCDTRIDSLDAFLILQASADLLETLPCWEAADVNADGAVDARDAQLVLQFNAGLIQEL